MRQILFSALILIGVALVHLPSANSESPPCKFGQITLPLESKIASAGITANLFGTESSVKGVAKALLSSALDVLPSKVRNMCPGKCGRAEPKVFLRAIPSKFLSNYDDEHRCEMHLASTRNSPLTFRDFTFASIDDFADSFSDFSRGKGPMGEELYEKCDGDCSPQFTLKIKQLDDGTFAQDADVVCGHARDQDDDTYTVSTELVVSCNGE